MTKNMDFRNRFLKILSVIVLVAGISNAACAQDDIWEIIETRNDVVITEENGIKTARFSGDVVYTQTKNGDTHAVDHSGLGAVSCTWMMYAEIENLIRQCLSEGHENRLQAYQNAIVRIENFIVENSLTPISKDELQEAKNNISSRQDDLPLEFRCQSEFLPGTDEDLSEEKAAEFKVKIDKLLSVPRPPVLNPCL